jgi:hypothetical protein
VSFYAWTADQTGVLEGLLETVLNEMDANILRLRGSADVSRDRSGTWIGHRLHVSSRVTPAREKQAAALGAVVESAPNALFAQIN